MITLDAWRISIGLFNSCGTLSKKLGVVEKQHCAAMDQVLKYLSSIWYFSTILTISSILCLSLTYAGRVYVSKTNELCSDVQGANDFKNMGMLLKPIIEVMLIIGGVESNPGPNGNYANISSKYSVTI